MLVKLDLVSSHYDYGESKDNTTHGTYQDIGHDMLEDDALKDRKIVKIIH